MTDAYTCRVLCKRPEEDAWMVIQRVTGVDEEAVRAEAQVECDKWKQHSTDRLGPFHNWDFKVEEKTTWTT